MINSQKKNWGHLILCLLTILFALLISSSSASAQINLPTQVTATAQINTNIWTYTALGDSLATGLGSVLNGYAYRYRNYIQSDTGTLPVLGDLGIPSAKSADLLLALRLPLGVRTVVSQSKIVTWDIGSNDLSAGRDKYKARTCGGADNQDCLRTTVATLKTNWGAIAHEIVTVRNPSNTIIRTIDFYNPFVARDKAADTWPNDRGSDFAVFKPYIDDANQFIAQASAANNIPYAKVSVAFNGPNGDIDPGTHGYIFIDGFHPNDAGYQKIAELLRNLGYAPLK